MIFIFFTLFFIDGKHSITQQLVKLDFPNATFFYESKICSFDNLALCTFDSDGSIVAMNLFVYSLESSASAF